MKINQENLADTVAYYMDDNELDYVHIRASLSSDGKNFKIVIIDDLEDED